ncbi:hypothetical protein [Sphingobium yanoikuyae]|uniref:hypothetical protein n=1 Tax=Sphingobium yanoikuyae TaxID=13690 RepID=UPI0022DDB811|nr:hypothetical protein [Sphingobium yanoikuyae]WBQ18914.1 hypothetical protein PAE53_23935 [Sphingobium yanoikuyae]
MTNFVAFQRTLFISSVSGKTGVAAQPIGVGARSTPPCNAAKISPGSVYHVVGVDHRFWYAFKAMDVGLKADENEPLLLGLGGWRPEREEKSRTPSAFAMSFLRMRR